MLRISSGSLGGRYIQQPPGRITRPMTDKVRQAVFNVLGLLDDMVVLDAYAGSGAAGFEAASRGAAMVEAIEANQKAARVIELNARELNLDFGYVLNVMTVETWLAIPANQPRVSRYDVIIADPPYQQLDGDVLERMAAFLKPAGVMVVSHGGKRPSPVLESLELVQNKVYGDSALSFYRRK
jgi:16S rRNA (guanine966-N2)-methyltransferase